VSSKLSRAVPPVAGLAMGSAAALLWIRLDGMHWSVRAAALLLSVVLPLMMIAQGRALRQAEADGIEIPRLPAYLSSSVALWALAGVTMAAAAAGGFRAADLGLVWQGVGPTAAWTTLGVAAGLAVTVASRAIGVQETRSLEELLPRSARERTAWVGVSLTAGICEELVFRAFLIPVLAVATGSLWLAVGLGSLIFGTLHAYQGMPGIVRTAILGLVLAVPLVVTGSVIPSIVAHVALDLVIGLWLADWLLRRESDAERRELVVDTRR
jgi:uncharacterized protein